MEPGEQVERPWRASRKLNFYTPAAMVGYFDDLSRPSRRGGQAAVGAERERLWVRFKETGDDVDGYSTRRPTETAIVVLEPRTD